MPSGKPKKHSTDEDIIGPIEPPQYVDDEDKEDRIIPNANQFSPKYPGAGLLENWSDRMLSGKPIKKNFKI